MSVFALRDKLLQWWNLNKYILARLAQKYLGIVATPIPSERVFSAAGNILSA